MRHIHTYISLDVQTTTVTDKLYTLDLPYLSQLSPFYFFRPLFFIGGGGLIVKIEILRYLRGILRKIFEHQILIQYLVIFKKN